MRIQRIYVLIFFNRDTFCTYWGLQNNWESCNGFQQFSRSKFVQKSVENRFSSPNYFAIGSTCTCINTCKHIHARTCMHIHTCTFDKRDREKAEKYRNMKNNFCSMYIQDLILLPISK